MKRVLSIQSHVVFGYVGNKAATFPLQLLGYNVDPMNTLQFSNHLAHKHVKGDRLEGSQLDALFEGLDSNGLLKEYSHVLTGYIGRSSCLSVVMPWIKRMKEKGVIVLIDPVMGDEGKLYVPDDVVPIYRDNLLQYADITTPNAFEAELLTGIRITTRQDAFDALAVIHSKGPRVAIISSAEIEPSRLHLFLSFRALSNAQSDYHHEIAITKSPYRFTGTGDVFSALVLGYIGSELSFERVVAACEKAVSVIQTIIKETIESWGDSNDPPSTVARELRIIECKDSIIRN